MSTLWLDRQLLLLRVGRRMEIGSVFGADGTLVRVHLLQPQRRVGERIVEVVMLVGCWSRLLDVRAT